MVDPITVIVTALALGAAAGLRKSAETAVIEAYQGLKDLLSRKYSQVKLAVIEAAPDDQHLQAFVEKELRQAHIDQDMEVVAQALAVQEAARQTAPSLADVVGVKLIDAQAANIIIERIRSAGIGVYGEGLRASGDIRISGVTAGTLSPQAQLPSAAVVPIKILFLAANPTDSARLRLDEEVRSIDQALRQSEFRDRFNLEQHWAVRVSDLQGLLMRHQPHIVHFSGHGSAASAINSSKEGRDVKLISVDGEQNEADAIILEDDNGNSHPVSARALSTLFSVLKGNIRCVVLNACYSEPQARAIAQHIDCVVGMSTTITDRAAISFATAFYQALGFGRDVKTAFASGRAQIDLENIPEEQTPQLLATKDDLAQVVLTVPKALAP